MPTCGSYFRISDDTPKGVGKTLRRQKTTSAENHILSNRREDLASIPLSDPDAPGHLLPDELLDIHPIDLAHINSARGVDRDSGGVVQSFDLLQDLAVFYARNE
jgi:hypothetical protein